MATSAATCAPSLNYPAQSTAQWSSPGTVSSRWRSRAIVGKEQVQIAVPEVISLLAVGHPKRIRKLDAS